MKKHSFQSEDGKFKISVNHDRFSDHQISICTNGFQSTVTSVKDFKQLKHLRDLLTRYIDENDQPTSSD